MKTGAVLVAFCTSVTVLQLNDTSLVVQCFFIDCCYQNCSESSVLHF